MLRRIVKTLVFPIILSYAVSVFAFSDSLQSYLTTYSPSPNPELFCPGLSITLSCGNGVCEGPLENEYTCPADCLSALVKSYNYQTLCDEVQAVYEPKTTIEVQNIVRQANNQGKRVKVIGKLHSASDMICTDGVVISTEFLNADNDILGIEMFEGKETVKVAPGVTLKRLGDWLHERDRSIGYTPIGFNGASIAGLIATGSHGSSPQHYSVMSSRVASIELVDAAGELVEFSAQTSEQDTWKALKANLGLLGVVVGLRLEIEPQFNLDINVTYHDEDELFPTNGETIFDVVEGCDFALINWFVGTGEFMKTCGQETTAVAQPGAQNVLLQPGIPAPLLDPYQMALQMGACRNELTCRLENARMKQFALQPPFVIDDENGDPKYVTNAIGPSHRMMSSALIEASDGFFQMDWEIVVPQSQAQAALEEVRALLQEYDVCVPLVGVFLRFSVSEDETLLAHTVSEGMFKQDEPVLFIEIPVYVPTAFPPDKKAQYDEPYEAFTNMLIHKYHGRAHWAKNREWVFDVQRDLNVYGDRLERFQRVVERLDPNGVFSNRFGERLGLVWKLSADHR